MRGWGEADFRLVRPSFLALIRHGLLAESVGPIIGRLEGMVAQDMSGISDPHTKLSIARQKSLAGEALGPLRSLIYPEDDDG